MDLLGGGGGAGWAKIIGFFILIPCVIVAIATLVFLVWWWANRSKLTLTTLKVVSLFLCAGVAANIFLGGFPIPVVWAGMEYRINTAAYNECATKIIAFDAGLAFCVVSLISIIVQSVSSSRAERAVEVT